MSVSEVEQDEYTKNVKDYADQANAAVDTEDFALAATIWETILDDEDMSALFDEDNLAHMRSRVDWARGFESATDGVYFRAAERWQKVIDAGHLNDWFGSDGEQQMIYNLAKAHALAGEHDKAKDVMSSLSEADQDEIRTAANMEN